MKVPRKAVAVVAALTLTGAAALPVWAFETFNNQAQAINAEIVPTREQVQSELSSFHERLEAANKASFYSAKASSEYLAAQRFFGFGRYDEALSHARSGDAAVPNIPNWVTPASVAR